jgi:hypothetical protein
MPNLPSLLTPTPISLEDILLDPNNPRFAELGQELESVPEIRFAEPRVQQQAFDRMKTPRFDVAELRDTIKNLGFLPMDRIVVRKWRTGPPDNGKYIVVEGNRRIAALKWLLDLHQSGRETFSPEQLDNFTALEVLLLEDQTAPESVRWVLPGLRHVSGIKEWGPYQKARAVHVLRESGMTPQEAAQSLGLSTRAANQLWRSYLALEQMRADEEYGEHAEPSFYSYFEEVFKRGNVRDWLGWDDAQRCFTNAQRLHEFYAWAIGEINETGALGEPKLRESKSVRDLGTIIDDPGALAVFRSPNGSLDRALARFEAEHPQEWATAITNAETVLAALSPDVLRTLTEQDIALLQSLLSRVGRVLDDRRRLLEG